MQSAETNPPATPKPPYLSPNEPHFIVARAFKHGETASWRGKPYFRHGTREAAFAEARRLAAQDPGGRFNVFEFCGYVEAEAPEAERQAAA